MFRDTLVIWITIIQYSGNNSEGINNEDILNYFQNSVEPRFSLNFEGKLEKNLGEAKIISNLLSKSISIQIKCGDYT